MKLMLDWLSTKCCRLEHEHEKTLNILLKVKFLPMEFVRSEAPYSHEQSLIPHSHVKTLKKPDARG